MSDNNYSDIYYKFMDLNNELELDIKIDDNEKLLLCKNFINNIKENSQVKKFIHRDIECFNNIKFYDIEEYDNKLVSHLKISSNNWSNIQLLVLLYETNFNGSKSLIKNLYKKIKIQETLLNNNEDVLSEDAKNDMLNNLKKMLPNNESTKDSKDLIKGLIGNIKSKLNEKDKFNPAELINMTKELSNDYQEKIQSGELNISNLLSSVMELMSNPDDLSNQFEGIENKIDGNHEDIMNEMKKTIFENGENPLDMLNSFGGNNKDGLENIMNMAKMMGEGDDNSNIDMNSIMNMAKMMGDNKDNNDMNGMMNMMKMVGDSNLLQNMTTSNDKKEETEEDIIKKKKDLEEYYNNLSV